MHALSSGAPLRAGSMLRALPRTLAATDMPAHTAARSAAVTTASTPPQLIKHVKSVPNIRDLADAAPSAILPGRLIRCARPMGASPADVKVLVDDVGVRDLVDLRSAEELAEDGDPRVAASTAAALSATLKPSTSAPAAAAGADGASAATAPGPDGAVVSELKRRVRRFHALRRSWLTGVVQLPQLGGAPPHGPLLHHQLSLLDKARFYVLLLLRIPWTVSLRAVLLALLGFRTASRALLAKEVNQGGLGQLYVILLESARPEILAVLQLVTASLERRRPVMVFCRAGKDRTGVIAMLLLSVAGADREAILDDYVKSEQFHKVALAGLEDKDELKHLDRSVFEGAPRSEMAACLDYIKARHGSVEKYLTAIGFGPERQRRLRQLMYEAWDT